MEVLLLVSRVAAYRARDAAAGTAATDGMGTPSGYDPRLLSGLLPDPIEVLRWLRCGRLMGAFAFSPLIPLSPELRRGLISTDADGSRSFRNFDLFRTFRVGQNRSEHFR